VQQHQRATAGCRAQTDTRRSQRRRPRRNRRKWNRLGKLAYALSERVSCVLADTVVTDAEEIKSYYLTQYGRESVFVPYGSDLPHPAGHATLDRLGLTPGNYVLYVSRFEPENNPDAVVQGFAAFSGNLKLALVGSAPYSEGLIARLHAQAAKDPRVLLPGAVYGEGYRELLANAAVYVHATGWAARTRPSSRPWVRPAAGRPRHAREPRVAGDTAATSTPRAPRRSAALETLFANPRGTGAARPGRENHGLASLPVGRRDGRLRALLGCYDSGR
jgi:glycosyltransferase involved in cell wall biosynthesis